MKAFVSTDMEGLPHIVSNEHMSPGGKLYDEARLIMTECVLAVVEELRASGADKVIVADGHGPKINLIPQRMPEYVDLVRGNPRSVSMISGARGTDMALFVGYHAKPGTPNSTFDHTIDDVILRRVKLNGEESSEFYMNAATLGEQGVPVVLVAGDRTLLEGDVEKFAPWIVRVALKEGMGRFAAISPSMPRCLDAIRRGVKTAVAEFRDNKMKPLILTPPVEVEVSFTSSAYAHIASHLPRSQRIGGFGLRYEAQSMEEAYRVIQLLTWAASGVQAAVGT